MPAADSADGVLLSGSPVGARRKLLLCPPDLGLMHDVVTGVAADATYIIQQNIGEGLSRRGHRVRYLASYRGEGIVVSDDLRSFWAPPRTWTARRWFSFAHSISWRAQQLLGIPYLSVFSNYALMDAAMGVIGDVDLVYERSTLYRTGIARACRRLALPYVLYVEADDILEHDIMGTPITGALRWRAAGAFRYNLHAADRVVCVSPALKAQLVDRWGLPSSKVLVFPNVADVSRFKPNVLSRSEVRLQLGLGEDPIVLFVGNFYVWHDVGTLLNAFAEVLKSQPAAKLVLVGDGAHRPAMMQKATDLGIDHASRFVGLLSHAQVPGFMAAADISVVPYPQLEQEVWLSPLKLFEYMASGNAIIASSVGQVAAWIRDGENGLLVAPGDSTSMAAALARLISEPALRERLGRSARLDAVKEHSWDHYLSRLEGVFQDAIEREPRQSH